MLIQSLAKSGGRSEAVKLSEDLVNESRRRYVSPYILAMASTALGEKDEAIALLEKDIAERGTYVSGIETNPEIDDLRGDPRFAALVKKIESSKLD